MGVVALLRPEEDKLVLGVEDVGLLVEEDLEVVSQGRLATLLLNGGQERGGGRRERGKGRMREVRVQGTTLRTGFVQLPLRDPS